MENQTFREVVVLFKDVKSIIDLKNVLEEKEVIFEINFDEIVIKLTEDFNVTFIEGLLMNEVRKFMVIK